MHQPQTNNFGLKPGWIWRKMRDQDSQKALVLVFSVLEEYGLKPDPEGVDGDIINWSNYYRAAGCGFWVLERERDSMIMGTVALYRETNTRCELRKMYFLPQARGHGLGLATLEWIVQVARSWNYQQVTLETASVLQEAIALYQKFGFKILPRDNQVSRCDLYMQLSLADNK